MWQVLVGFALGAEPAVSVRQDGSVHGTVTIQADASAVRAVMSDPVLVASIEGGTKVSAKKDGDCQLVSYTIPHPLMEVSYTARGCSAGDGMVYTLVESEDLKRFTSSWMVSAAGEGQTTLEYTVLTVPSFPMPQRIISYQATAGVERFLARVAQHIEARR